MSDKVKERSYPVIVVVEYYNSIFSDKRRRVIAIFFIISWILTGLTFWYFWSDFGQTHSIETEKEIFVAWSGELLFFTLIGAAIALVSLERDPLTKEFRDRAKIFFGKDGIPGVVEAYLLEQFCRAGVFCERGRWEVEIQEYDAEHKAYKVRAKTHYVYQNPVRDQAAHIDVTYGIAPDKFDHLPADAEVGRYMSILVGGLDHLQRRGPIKVPQAGFSDKVQIRVPGDGSIEVVMDYTVLMKVGEEQRIRPQRFLQVFDVSITDRSDASPRILVTGAASSGGTEESRTLTYGEPYRPIAVQGVAPREVAFAFRLGEPEPKVAPSASDVTTGGG